MLGASCHTHVHVTLRSPTATLSLTLSGKLAYRKLLRMPISDAQKTATGEVIAALANVKQGGRYKRALIMAFMDLPDQDSFPDYYDVIPNPRCINGVKDGLEKGSYKDCLDVHEDLDTIFLNAQHYNEEGSSIYADAEKLRVRCLPI
jgi:chromatin structure-remodeling complex subunit RSC1/2